jgi:hypothetical protein
VTVGPREGRALVFTRVPAPWWAPGFLIIGKFIDSIPEYAAVPRLEHKAYTLSDDRRFGGLYVWPDRASAEAFFDEAWHARVRKSRGVDGEVTLLDAWWTVEGVPAQGRLVAPHGLRADAAVVWVWAPSVDDVSGRLEGLAATHGLPAGVVRSSFVTSARGGAGVVELWASAAQARAFWTPEQLAATQTALGGAVTLTWFAAPVLLDVAAGRVSRAESLPEGATRVDPPGDELNAPSTHDVAAPQTAPGSRWPVEVRPRPAPASARSSLPLGAESPRAAPSTPEPPPASMVTGAPFEGPCEASLTARNDPHASSPPTGVVDRSREHPPRVPPAADETRGTQP